MNLHALLFSLKKTEYLPEKAHSIYVAVACDFLSTIPLLTKYSLYSYSAIYKVEALFCFSTVTCNGSYIISSHRSPSLVMPQRQRRCSSCLVVRSHL